MLNPGKTSKGLKRLCNIFIAMIMAALLVISSVPAYVHADTEESAADENMFSGMPIREVHRVKVDKKRYCFFAQYNVVITPKEIAELKDDGKLALEIANRAGVYIREANCRREDSPTFTAEEWVKSGKTLLLNQEDVEKIRQAAPTDGDPVLMYMDLRVSDKRMVKKKVTRVIPKEEGASSKDEADAKDAAADADASADSKDAAAETDTTADTKDAAAETDTTADTKDAAAETDTAADAKDAAAETDTAADAKDAAADADTATDANDAAAETDAAADANDAAAETDAAADSKDAASETDAAADSKDAASETDVAADSKDAAAETDAATDSKDAEKKEEEFTTEEVEIEDIPTYSTRKLLQPHLLYVAIASEKDANTADDVCEYEDDGSGKPDENIPDEPAEPEEILPEYRTIPMADRTGPKLEPTLADGKPVTLEWVEPSKGIKSDDKVSTFDKLPGGAAGPAAALIGIAAALAYFIKRRRDEKE